MDITLKTLTITDAEKWHELQVEAFTPFLIKYQDYEINPAAETIEKVIGRFNNPIFNHYFILKDGIITGGVRISQWEDTTRFRLNSLFIVPEFQNLGIGQWVMKMIEELKPEATSWELDTLLQEERNIHFYEKFGYKREGEEKVINDKLSTVFYIKHLK